MKRENTTEYLSVIKEVKSWKQRIAAMLPLFSLLVVLTVFWGLKLTGITLAGDAFCGYKEHEHGDSCYGAGSADLICGLDEHIHKPECYSDITADVESAKDWEATLPTFEDYTVLERIFSVANTQQGYRESERNFIVDENREKHGYTRYGEWYGHPYGDWSAMFVSFCLRYAGLGNIPVNSGPEAMRVEWESEGLYTEAAGHTPLLGQIVFLDKDLNGQADSVAVVFQSRPKFITVYEGDYENAVSTVKYYYADSQIMGFGLPDTSSSLTVLDKPTDDNLQVGGVDKSNEQNDVMIDSVLQNAAAENGTRIAITTEFNGGLAVSTNHFVVYTSSGSEYYAFDGNGNAVPITVAPDGGIYAEVEDHSILFWTFTTSGNNYLIQNINTGKYMHAFANNGGGVTTSGAYTSTLVSSGSQYKIRSNSTDYAMLDTSSGKFVRTGSSSSAASFSFGLSSQCYIWLDGTNGGLMSLGGSPNVCYTVNSEQIVKLPSEWQSPTKYSQTLRGWYDVTNSVYYPAGAEVIVKGNMVLYADWMATTYDIGQFNAQAVNSISTNHIITTRVFDYNYLFNVLSQRATVSANSSSHSETWSHVASGNVPYNNANTLDFIFSDNDSGGKISMANNRNSNNQYEADVPIKTGILTEEIADILFNPYNSFDPQTGEGIIGKNYLGTGDYLFQYMNDPSSPYYGYYYYDSNLNSAAYNQSEQRFYVYDYLVRTSDSANASGTEQYSDFLPFNSPYANTNGQYVPTYYYDGLNGEYANTTHYTFDIKYNTDNTNVNNVGANAASGLSMEMKFYIPDTPGEILENGQTGNRDFFGNEMHYQFSGDDDLWVLIDGEIILDLGGIHGSVSGDINFSTGIVTANGQQQRTIYDLEPGEHTFTVYYLERGSSQSNCSMYFNIAPRFSLDIYKEDVLTQESLDGAEFTVYTDSACTVPATLWESKAAYEAGLASRSSFTVQNGVAKMWGLSPGKIYYIKETGPPNHEGYELSKGIIHLTFDIKGIATFDIEINEENPGAGISAGYTVHSYKVDFENQAAYMTVTNAQDWVKDITSVQAFKVWNDTKDHSSDYVTIYLSIKDPDGTVRRIREAILGEENGWTYTWTNLPKYAADGVTEIEYLIEESYTQGYSSTVEKVDSIMIDTTQWEEAASFVNGEKYLLLTSYGYLSAQSTASDRLKFISEAEARAEYNTPGSLATWTATVSGDKVKFTNGCGQIITLHRVNSYTYYYRVTNDANNTNQVFSITQNSSGMLFYINYYGGKRHIAPFSSSGTSNQYLQAVTSESSALYFHPMILEGAKIEQEIQDIGYKITNAPLERETSLTVNKQWDLGIATNVYYDNIRITVKLLANGKDTGRTLTLELKNSWSSTFRGIPYEDENGVPIVYTISEVSAHPDWEPFYGEVVTIPGTTPTYETVLTNVYRYGHGYQLPETGGMGKTPLILCGLSLMLGSLVYGCVLIRKRERRHKS